VSDTLYRVQKFDSSGTYLAQWGSGGSGDGQLSGSYFGLALDSSNAVYVADEDNNRVQKFDTNGTYLTQLRQTVRR
jgi:DNA-binding beta-propeller fold protein YncE